MTDAEKLAAIADICRHPGAFHWSGQQMASVITKVIDGEQPIPYALSTLDEPIPYELSHDAVWEDLE